MRWRGEALALAPIALMLAGCAVEPNRNEIDAAGATDLGTSGNALSSIDTFCPVGGEKFRQKMRDYPGGAVSLPDGMRMESDGSFRDEPWQCPGNGLVVYRDYKPEELPLLAAAIAKPDYQALRRTETPSYLAYRLALALDDRQFVPHLLQRAGWEAKSGGPSERVRRYNEEFIVLVRTLEVDPEDLDSILFPVFAANALRELGRFDEAEAMRAFALTRPWMAGEHGNYVRDQYILPLASAIARRDTSRDPIEMSTPRPLSMRCRGMDFTSKPRALTPFEKDYCRRPEIAKRVREFS